ncbi:FeoC-like transcriptional regulator [Sansalvadorimonas sp. 2012CJ34-2]|uniref:FeoC-like transcriptional regulator n=1 Tax=Parendozoicomonas callyspongiae TaxID=2942213 RepID=A0ABT0PKH2_9GAMM|nr:FeoC-like transcriptional regulator [Sansalvadorimonas sp. 2012CJ34-2]
MLSDIRRYLMSRDQASLYELSNRFNVEESVMSGMLSHWIRKGQVTRSQAPCDKACGGCDKANVGEWYCWVTRKEATGMISFACTKD